MAAHDSDRPRMDILDLTGELTLIKVIASSPNYYAALNGTHILGISLLIGGLASHHLSYLRNQTTQRSSALAVTITGLLLAILTGTVLFMIRPAEYLNSEPFLFKLLLIATGLCNSAVFSMFKNHRLRKSTVIVSTAVWVCAVYQGRWIGFFSEI